MMAKKKRSKDKSNKPKVYNGKTTWTLKEWNDMFCDNYVSFLELPEVQTCIHKIASLVSSMTLQLVENTEGKEVRIHNALSRFMDIQPNKFMTRKTFVYNIVYDMLVNGNSVILPEFDSTTHTTVEGQPMVDNLTMIDGSRCSFSKMRQDGYDMQYSGNVYNYGSFLHIPYWTTPQTPHVGEGVGKHVKEIVRSLVGSSKIKSTFFEGGYLPPVIIKMDAFNEHLSDEDKRKELYDRYIKTKDGVPMIIPAELIEIQEIKPFSIKDMAVIEGAELDKKTIANIFGIPTFFLGVGTFNADEYNNFVNTTISDIAETISSVFTKGLLIKSTWRFRFNSRSLMSYDINTLSKIGIENVKIGNMSGNEVREWIGLSPKDGLDEHIALENYIPLNQLQEQRKLKGGE